MTQFQFDPLPAVKSEGGFRDFVKQLDGYFETLGYARTRLRWAKQKDEPYDPALQGQLDEAGDRLYTESNHATIKTWKDKATDSTLQRWGEVLDWEFTLARLEQQPDLRKISNHISDRYVHWRPKVDGQEIPYIEQGSILRYAPDRERRRKVWMAQWELGEELEESTREMFRLRNQGAQGLGYPTYGDLRLQADGVSRQWLLKHFDEMERVTGPIFSDFVERQADNQGLPDVQPWDSQYLFEQGTRPDNHYFPADKLEQNLFACGQALGIDTARMGVRLYPYDSPYGGECVTYAPKDIRILTQMVDGIIHYHTAYHEYGHALHSWFYDQPYSLQRESGMFTEGMAQFMGLFLHYPSWLRRSGLPDDEINRYRETRKVPWMYSHRRIAAMVAAELAVWDNPEVDFNRAYGEANARYLGMAYQPQPFAAVPRWTWPVRLQSYFIADLISAQTHAFLRSNFAPIFGRPDAIAHVRDHYWKPGNSIPWLEKVRRCTGEELTYHYLGLEMAELLPDA